MNAKGIRELAAKFFRELYPEYEDHDLFSLSTMRAQSAAFAESIVEQCCKDVCAWCREPSVTYDTKAVQVHGTWKHRYNNGGLVDCRAAAIRSRWQIGEG